VATALLAELTSPAESEDFFNAVLTEAKALPYWLTEPALDVVVAPVLEVLSHTDEFPAGDRGMILIQVLRRLRSWDRIRAYEALAPRIRFTD
jgi:hypothetical protein